MLKALFQFLFGSKKKKADPMAAQNDMVYEVRNQFEKGLREALKKPTVINPNKSPRSPPITSLTLESSALISLKEKTLRKLSAPSWSISVITASQIH